MFLTREQIDQMGFRYVGKNVKISDKASFYNTQNIAIGDNVRIDDFVVLSGGVLTIIDDYVHIATHCSILGRGRFSMLAFSGLSSHVSVFTSSDPYDGSYMTNPTIPGQYLNTKHGKVMIGRHSVIGAGSTILPGSDIPDNVAIGAMSLVTSKSEIAENGIYAGVPVKFIKPRLTDNIKMGECIQ